MENGVHENNKTGIKEPAPGLPSLGLGQLSFSPHNSKSTSISLQVHCTHYFVDVHVHVGSLQLQLQSALKTVPRSSTATTPTCMRLPLPMILQRACEISSRQNYFHKHHHQLRQLRQDLHQDRGGSSRVLMPPLLPQPQQRGRLQHKVFAVLPLLSVRMVIIIAMKEK